MSDQQALTAIGVVLVVVAILVAVVSVGVAVSSQRVAFHWKALTGEWSALAQLRGGNITTLMNRIIELEATEARVERLELDRGHWRESSYEHLRARQTLEAEMQWMANESHLAAERGEPWTFTATWPTPEELHRREMTKVLHEQDQHGEHRKTAAASGADA